jgi:hypothetical protein
MRDFQFWIYVIIGAIYLISRARKKRDTDPAETTTPRTERRFESNQETQTIPQKGMTFEELLREITETKEPAKPVIQSQPRTEYIDYDDNLEEEEQDLEEISTDYRKKDKAFYDTYENAKIQAFNRASLEETVKLEDTDMKFGKFKVFEEEAGTNYLNDYLKDLKDPDGFKKAFILSEVLQRRY